MPLVLLTPGVGCRAPASSGHSPSSKAASIDASMTARDTIEGPSTTYRITDVDDLRGTLQEALWKFEIAHRGVQSTFLVEILPGTYRDVDASLSLETAEDSDVAVVVFCNGPAPARLHGSSIHISASAVTVRNLVFEDAWGSDALIYIRFRTRATLDRVAVVGGDVTANDAEESMISIAGPGHVTVKDSWFVGNRSRGGSEAVFHLPLLAGRNAETTTIEMSNVVFAGNEAPCSVRPGWSNAKLRNVIFYEPRITHALICLAHPPHTLSIDDGIFVAGPKAIDYQISEHRRRSDYETVPITGTTVRLPSPIPPEDAIQRNVRYEPNRVPPSLDVVIEAARRGGAPTPTELGL